MRRQFSNFALAASFGLALAFTLSCSRIDDILSDGQSSSSEDKSSSSGIVFSSSSKALSSSGTTPSSSSLQLSSGSQAIVPVYGEPMIARDGQTYETVVVGTQTWTVKGLNFETETGSKCNEDNKLNCTIYARLYNWETAMTVCPEGWRLPSIVECVILSDIMGSKSKDYGFTANIGYATWTSTESSTGNAYYLNTSQDKSKMGYIHCVKGDNYSPSLNNSSYTPISCKKIPEGGFCDDRDGRGYKSTVIDGKTWMAENLNYNATGSKCFGEDGKIYYGSNNMVTISNSEVQSNCSTYGKLYDWATAMAFDQACNKTDCTSWVTEKHKGICPKGWHVPSKEEFQQLINCSECGAPSTAGYALKATQSWPTDRNGADLVGFSALNGGIGSQLSDGYYYYPNLGSSWWSSKHYRTSETHGGDAYRMDITTSNSASISQYGETHDLYSIRCVKD